MSSKPPTVALLTERSVKTGMKYQVKWWDHQYFVFQKQYRKKAVEDIL